MSAGFADIARITACTGKLVDNIRKKTFTGLLTNYFSFTPFSYKLGLIRTLVDRTYKINNTWIGFHEDIKKLLLILRKNLFPSHIVERVIKQYITKTQNLSNTLASPPSNPTHFFKLPYVGPFSIVAQNRLRKLLKRYCNNHDVKLAFLPSRSVTCLV